MPDDFLDVKNVRETHWRDDDKICRKRVTRK